VVVGGGQEPCPLSKCDLYLDLHSLVAEPTKEEGLHLRDGHLKFFLIVDVIVVYCVLYLFYDFV
jgi:hypothetical protein